MHITNLSSIKKQCIFYSTKIPDLPIKFLKIKEAAEEWDEKLFERSEFFFIRGFSCFTWSKALAMPYQEKMNILIIDMINKYRLTELRLQDINVEV